MNTEELKNERERQGITQEELAFRSDITQGTVAKIESGRVMPTLWLLKKLRKGLNRDLIVEIGKIIKIKLK